jgi:hypothetical protein
VALSKRGLYRARTAADVSEDLAKAAAAVRKVRNDRVVERFIYMRPRALD